ncbi:MAG: hypothetical protein Q8P56_04510 [Candidatus Uhrbacteria bacterium]|nr:hypothetical protein [Candidatus Uhrbacteria bacterium]
MPEQGITNDELARMIKDQFDLFGKRFDGVEKEIGGLKTDVGSLKSDVSSLKSDVAYLKSQMVTKEYLDEKLANLWGNVIVLFRKEDKRVSGVVSMLAKKEVFSTTDVRQLDALRPLVAIDQI